MPVTTYDPKSRELAEHFMQDKEFESPAIREENLEELSRQIQEAVEDFFAALEDVQDVH